MNLTIRPEQPSDFQQIFEVNKSAFKQDGEAKLVDLLRKSEHFLPQLSLVAIIDNKTVGHILFTRIAIENENTRPESLALAPMAVLPEYQNKGIGGQLIQHGLLKAKELGHQSVIVLGHEHYYPKFGFVPTTKWNIKAPFDVPADNFMGIELVENALQNISGTVRYAKEFETV